MVRNRKSMPIGVKSISEAYALITATTLEVCVNLIVDVLLSKWIVTTKGIHKQWYREAFADTDH